MKTVIDGNSYKNFTMFALIPSPSPGGRRVQLPLPSGDGWGEGKNGMLPSFIEWIQMFFPAPD
jgi:hypothetical protein